MIARDIHISEAREAERRKSAADQLHDHALYELSIEDAEALVELVYFLEDANYESLADVAKLIRKHEPHKAAPSWARKYSQWLS